MYDLGNPADLEIARRFALRADVLVENFREGTLARKGLGYVDLSAANLGRDTTDVWAARLTDVEVPAGKIGTVGSAIDLATSLDLDPIVSFGDESCSQVRHPISYSATPVTRYQPPPRLGADSDEVRRWLSGESAS